MKKQIILLLLVSPLCLRAQTGEKVMGPSTMGHPSYPNSGVGKRTNDMTGEDMSNATKMSSDVNPSVPSRRPLAERKKEKSPTQTGPYRDKNIYHSEEGPSGRQAQEAAKEKEFDLSKQEIKRKQKGQ